MPRGLHPWHLHTIRYAMCVVQWANFVLLCHSFICVTACQICLHQNTTTKDVYTSVNFSNTVLILYLIFTVFSQPSYNFSINDIMVNWERKTNGKFQKAQSVNQSISQLINQFIGQLCTVSQWENTSHNYRAHRRSYLIIPDCNMPRSHIE